MSDLIDRQDAIDAMTSVLWHYPNECYRNLNEYEFAKGLAELGLKSVPPVQPEQRWIPCSERLPEESGLYIVTNVGRWVEPVETRYYNIRADGGFWSGHPGYKVLAWMPLPEPYTERREE